MNNYSVKKDKLSQINLELFKEAIFACYKDGVTSVAPLGFSGDTVVLYEGNRTEKNGRVSQVSIRNYCGSAELLITDPIGGFLFYGRFDIDLGVDFLAKHYYRIFRLVKKNILIVSAKRSDFKNLPIPEGVERTAGFALLRAYQTGML